MIITKYVSKVGKGYKISPNFTLGEFQCKDGADKVIYDTVILARLEKIRAYYGGKITITSGYRTASYNKRIGGYIYSAHMYGQAVDFVVYNKIGTVVPSKSICLYLEGIGWKGSIGKMRTACHMDTKYDDKMDETKDPYYIFPSWLTFAQYFGYKKMTVNTALLNVRRTPSVYGTIVGTPLPKGRKVFIFEVKKDSKGREWARINYVYPRWVAKWLLV